VADNPSEFVCCRTQKFNSNIDSLPTLVVFVDSSKPTAILAAKRLINTVTYQDELVRFAD
jgi:hypothetical protein